jgi:glycosyl hydrolase family 16
MVGGLEAGRRVAAAALLALGSMVPHDGPLLTAPARIAPVADTGVACPVTVGTATTDPALANDAARAIAFGYALTDCMPNAELLAAAEARALIPMGTPAAGSGIVGTSSGIVGTSSGSAAGATANGSAAVTPPTTASPTTAPASALSDTATSDTATSDTATSDTVTSDTVTSDPAAATTSETTSESSSDDGAGIGSSDSSSSDNDTDDQVDSGTNSGDTDDGDTGSPTTDTPTTDSPTTDGPTTDATATAADTLAWGTPTGVEDFDGTLSNWGVYDGPGHAGKGRRSPSAVSVSGGLLTISGDANGTTGGMAWRLGDAKYGRWEARVKSPVADPAYHAVMLLWPDAENWPAGGEVDFMEISDGTRQKTDFFLHYGAADHQLHGEKVIDATQWHNWAVEWTPTTITGYVDGVAWFSTSRADALPPGPMHLTLQLDWFPGSGAARQSEMQVDWVRHYPVDGSASATAITTGETNTATTASVAGTTSTAVTATSTPTGTTTTTAPTTTG